MSKRGRKTETETNQVFFWCQLTQQQAGGAVFGRRQVSDDSPASSDVPVNANECPTWTAEVANTATARQLLFPPLLDMIVLGIEDLAEWFRYCIWPIASACYCSSSWSTPCILANSSIRRGSCEEVMSLNKNQFRTSFELILESN